MNYLKCSNCGHLNNSDKEALLFCEKCNKKLENNYRDWKKKRNESSFEDFQRLVCISEEDILSKSDRSKGRKVKSLKYWIGFIIMFAIAYAVAQFGGESIASIFRSEKTSNEVLSQEWLRETYGNQGLSVEVPVIMTEVELPLADNIKAVVEEMHGYEYASARGFKVFINSVQYKPVIQEISLQGAANGSVNEMKMQPGVTEFKYDETEITLEGIPGIRQEGAFRQSGTPVEFINICYGKGLNMWQVLVAYNTDDEVGRIASKRVVESIEIQEM